MLESRLKVEPGKLKEDFMREMESSATLRLSLLEDHGATVQEAVAAEM